MPQKVILELMFGKLNWDWGVDHQIYFWKKKKKKKKHKHTHKNQMYFMIVLPLFKFNIL